MIFALEDRRVELRGEEHFIAHNATVLGSVVLANRSSIWFNAVLRGDNDLIEVGEGSNVQDGAVLHTDPGIPLVLGRGVTVGHMAMLHSCRIGDNSLVGIKAVILNHARVGANCVIGANTLITEGKEIPDNSMVMGSPGRIVRTLTDEEVTGLKQAAASYIDKMRRYNRAFVEMV